MDRYVASLCKLSAFCVWTSIASVVKEAKNEMTAVYKLITHNNIAAYLHCLLLLLLPLFQTDQKYRTFFHIKVFLAPSVSFRIFAG